jgi:hypothetical protein
MTGEPAEGERWLLLIHQLPAKPAYLRVKVWRRLQSLGAVAVKNAVYALPAGEQAHEDFEWLLREIVAGGGEAFVCEARLIDGLSDQEVRMLFDQAREADYEAIAKDVRTIVESLGAEAPAPEQRTEARVQLTRLKGRLAQVVAIDFFGATGREVVDGLMAELGAKLAEDELVLQAQSPAANPMDLQGVHVDRIASAWLIRHFVDPEAQFKFVPAKDYRPEASEPRFDMFEAEFTHEGDLCTFEVLLKRMGLAESALQAIAEIVHDIDLKDGKFARAEADGIRTLIAAICMATRDDSERLARGATVFEDLYQYFRKKRR